MNEEGLIKLKADIAEFEAFKQSLERQQLTYPLDKKSLDVVHKDVVVPTGGVVVPFSLETYDTSVEILVNDKKYLLDMSSVK